jgi:glutamyl-tRNA synthetase
VINFASLQKINLTDIMDNKPRVRFAPSPTGALHIGGVRTALFNYLFAKKNGGTFILRIEDTDQSRYIPEAEQFIMDSLHWCGLKPDEGPQQGGDYGPYKQSDRKDIYQKYARQLIDADKAYYAFDSAEELDNIRKEYEAKGETFSYNTQTRGSLKNSISLSKEESQALINKGTNCVIRFKMPAQEEIVFNDIIRGEVRVKSATLDDKILLKADGMPTYHLANIVDDHLMEITHVIRGEEWLPSTPLHVMLYKSFGWESTMPRFAHIPLILKPTGKGKLSKRDGEKMGFPVYPIAWKDPQTSEIWEGFREAGYFPDAFLNIMALLGWNTEDDNEFFTKDELIGAFSLDRVGKGGARFDPEKARWFNHHYLTQKSDDELCKYFKPVLKAKGLDFNDDYVAQAISTIKERAELISDLWKHSFFYFQSPQQYNEKDVKKKWKEGTGEHISKIADIIENIEPFEADIIKQQVSAYIESNKLGFGKIMNPLRICLTGGSFGPDLFDMIEIIGKDEVVKRIRTAVQAISK